MTLDKKQIPMLVVLAVLVVACVGYLSFKVMSPARQPAGAANHANSAKSTEDSAKKPGEGAAAATVTPAPQTVGMFPDLMSVPARRDPFSPQKLPGGEPVEITARMAKCVPSLPQSIRNVTSRVPQVSVTPFNPFSKLQTTQSLPSMQSSRIIATKPEDGEPEEDFTLTGVVSGDSNVIIIRVGKTERHIVKEGETIDGRYKVKSVTGDGAVLVDGGRRISVKLGGNKNAK